MAARVSFRAGQGGLPLLRVESPVSMAEIYLQGAHVTHFQRRDDKPLLFLSRQAVFEAGKPIRGGIPVILPWFGVREGHSMHGFARTVPWDLQEVALGGDSVSLRLRMPEVATATEWPRFVAELEVRVGFDLRLELRITNVDDRRELQPLEACLHTYFAVGDIAQTEVLGLHGVSYEDALDDFNSKIEPETAIRMTGEVDRVYYNSPETVEIVDRSWRRVIRVEKQESLSTVVWNPWIAKAKRLPDFGDDEYQRMICIESGNVRKNGHSLAPGQTAAFHVSLESLLL